MSDYDADGDVTDFDAFRLAIPRYMLIDAAVEEYIKTFPAEADALSQYWPLACRALLPRAAPSALPREFAADDDARDFARARLAPHHASRVSVMFSQRFYAPQHYSFLTIEVYEMVMGHAAPQQSPRAPIALLICRSLLSPFALHSVSRRRAQDVTFI